MTVFTVATDDMKTRLRIYISRLPLKLGLKAHHARGRALSAASRAGRCLVRAVNGKTKIIEERVVLCVPH